MTLQIALPGPRLSAGGQDGADATLPRLPALTQLLRQARRLADASHWRAGVLASLGGDARTEAVSVAAAALPARAGDAMCFAAPLHVIAGISRVHLPPGGGPSFEAGEEQAFLAAFNAEFGGPDLALHAVAPGGGWLLASPFAAAARDLPPEELAGDVLAREAATDAEQRALRKFGAEVEMWFAAHPLNRARERRARSPLNTLWLWGGARVAVPAPLRNVPYVAAGGIADAWLSGLAVLAGTRCRQAAHWEQLMQFSRELPAAAGNTVLAVLAPDATGAPGSYWQGLEQDWFEPALRDVAAGAVADVRLQLGRSTWQLRRQNWLRWPTRRSWWQLSSVHA
jgi:hypothetical protein